MPVDVNGAITLPPESNSAKIQITPATKAKSIPLPHNYQDAVTGHYRDYWIQAISTELNNLISRDTWREEVKPPGKKVIPGRYVWKVKALEDGTIDKFKARWIMKGYMQKHGVDYDKTYAGVANIVTIRILLALACELDWELISMDVSAAYLCAKIEEHLQIYIQAPTGYKLDKGKDARLLSGLYGSAKGGAIWAKHRTETLKTLGYKRNLAEPSMYMRSNGDGTIFIGTIVDDFIIVASSKLAAAKAKQQLNAKWKMTGGKDLLWVVKLKIRRDRNKRKLTVCQDQYILDIAERIGLQKAKTKETPTQSGITLSKAMCPQTKEEKEHATTLPYQSLIGSILHCRLTRPDILQSISKAAKYMQNHGKGHW